MESNKSWLSSRRPSGKMEMFVGRCGVLCRWHLIKHRTVALMDRCGQRPSDVIRWAH